MEYIAFMAMVGSLFVVAGHIHIEGHWRGKPLSNAILLLAGALMANVLGTTGASMLLIRLLLSTNEWRKHRWHLPVFFIFMVSNTGGLLTPLGDPPLFLGYLSGVPFFWTLKLWPAWLIVNGALLAIFFVIDSWQVRREEPQDLSGRHRLTIQGARNFLFLVGIVAAVLLKGWMGDSTIALLVASGLMGLMALMAYISTSAAIRFENGFTWEPVHEVGALFLGLFLTMSPAMELLAFHANSLPITQPWHYFWITGLLSSFLDNAPTYAVIAVIARTQATPDALNLEGLAADPHGALLLAAICCGAVFMGANTYIGNGPNFMVRTIAVSQGYHMPGFLTYLGLSMLVLGPLYLAVTWILF
jgi:Na+/H+ antiporter NhaD/arsenite permease-like protein